MEYNEEQIRAEAGGQEPEAGPLRQELDSRAK
jgi:hypothetical protein